MTRTDRVVLLEIVGPFFGSVLLFTSLFLAAGELQKLAEFSQKGVSPGFLLLMVLFTMPYILAYTIPMAMLLATLLGFGRLSGDSEIVALFASGTSFPRIMAPVVGFALAIALPIIAINQSLIPAANHKRETMAMEIRQRGSTATTTTEAFTLAVKAGDNQQYIVHAAGGVRFGTGGKAYLDRVAILLYEKGMPIAAVGARRAEWKIGTTSWVLIEDKPGELWMAESQKSVVLYGRQIRLREVELGKPKELESLEGRVTELSTEKLAERAQLRHAEGDHAAAREAEIEAQARVSFPLSALVFAMVGAPLGIQRTRSGKGMGFGLSVLVTFVYWTTVQIFQAIGKGGGMPALVACEVPNLVGIGVGIWLIWRVTQRGAVN